MFQPLAQEQQGFLEATPQVWWMGSLGPSQQPSRPLDGWTLSTAEVEVIS